MKLVHFTDNKELKKELQSTVQKTHKMRVGWWPKPTGLWVSDEEEYGWKQWCDDENFEIRNNGMNYAYTVTLKPDTHILYITTSHELDTFTEEYKIATNEYGMIQGIQWDKIAEKYQGIIITPYQWGRRLTLKTSWYYGWDCASGCIWDVTCIKTMTKRKNKKETTHE